MRKILLTVLLLPHMLVTFVLAAVGFVAGLAWADASSSFLTGWDAGHWAMLRINAALLEQTGVLMAWCHRWDKEKPTTEDRAHDEP